VLKGLFSMSPSKDYPKLRPVEVVPVEEDGQRLLVINDPSGLAGGSATVTPATLFILTLLDGEHGPEAIQQECRRRLGVDISSDQLGQLIGQLDEAHYLDNENFAVYLDSKVSAYRSAPARISSGDLVMPGADEGDLAATIERVLASVEKSTLKVAGRRLAGLIVPHLDFVRGMPCYADGYRLLSPAEPVGRYVILGTNHFGWGASVVATGKDFQTPLGTARTDRAFLAELESRLQVDLCEHEFDHQGEHSIELQVLILQHLLGESDFEIVPLLCPDPCGPAGTAPEDDHGVDLCKFAETLGELIRADAKPTTLIAGADLSHVGMRFGDESELDEEFLTSVEAIDRQLLEAVAAGDGDKFVRTLVGHENSTRVCGTGAIYTLLTAVTGAQPELIRYHQAVDRAGQTCVTCCAVAFWGG